MVVINRFQSFIPYFFIFHMFPPFNIWTFHYQYSCYYHLISNFILQTLAELVAGVLLLWNLCYSVFWSSTVILCTEWVLGCDRWLIYCASASVWMISECAILGCIMWLWPSSVLVLLHSSLWIMLLCYSLFLCIQSLSYAGLCGMLLFPYKACLW